MWIDDLEEIASCFSNFYLDLFSIAGQRDLFEALKFVKPMVTNEMNDLLIGPVSLEEVKAPIFQLGKGKASGPDGFSRVFSQASWENIKFQVFDLVEWFWDEGGSLEMINSTNIVLIPKVGILEPVGQFRPIGLCNFIYKVISRVLVNRLKNVLPNIISEQQGAFVPGRIIHDNVVLAHEAYDYLSNKKSGGRFDVAVGFLGGSAADFGL